MRSASGSIIKLGTNYYRVFVTGKVIDPKTGKPKKYSQRVRGSRKKAEEVKIALDIKAGNENPAAQRMTLDMFWEELYRPYCEKNVRERTLEGYESNYNCLLRGYLGSYPMVQITPLAIDQWLMNFQPRRRYEAYKMLRQMLRKAYKWNVISSNPIDHVDEPKREDYQPEVLTAEQAAEYLKRCRGTKAELIVLLAIGGGFRREELVALNWSDISDDGAITINKAITSVHGKSHEDSTKTPFSERLVYLPKEITERVNGLRGTGAVFQVDGVRMHPDTMSKYYKQWRDKLPDSLPRISLKNLRHTSLTLALEGGADILSVSRRAGHSNVNITSKYYLRPSPDLDKVTSDGLGAVLSGANSTESD